MPGNVFQRSIQDEAGNVMPGASVEVRDQVTSTLVQLYSDYDLATTIGNPTTADADGFVRFYVAPGRYRIVATSGAVSRTWEDEVLGLIESSGIQYVRTATEISGGITPSDEQYRGDKIEFNARRYGAVLDDATNDVSAIQAALSACDAAGGGRVVIDGPAVVASASLPLTIGDNTEIVFPSKDCGITVTGSTVNHLFSAVNKKNISILGGYAVGNNQADGFALGLFLSAIQNGSATGIGGNIRIEGTSLFNFKGDFWIYFRNTGGTYTFRNFWVDKVACFSLTGNSRGPTNIGIPDSFIAFQGSGSDADGLVENGWVTDCFFDGTYKKMGVIAWHGTKNIHIANNNSHNMGALEVTDDKGAYAFMAYDNTLNDGGPGGLKPDLIFFDGNIALNPRSCGIYVAGGARIYVNGAKVEGQTDTTDSILPKGAVVINGADYARVRDVHAKDCYAGVVLFGDSTSSDIEASGCTVNGVANNGYAYALHMGSAGKAERIALLDSTADADGTSTRAVFLRFTSTNGVEDLIVRGCKSLKATTRVIDLENADADIAHAEIGLNGIIGNGATHGVRWMGADDTETQLHLHDNIYRGTWASNAAMCDVSDSFGLIIEREKFFDATSITTGFAIKTNGSRGSIEGVKFRNIAAARRIYAAGTEELGFDTPTWSSEEGVMVQYLGAGDDDANEMILMGWINYGTTNWHGLYISTVSPAS